MAALMAAVVFLGCAAPTGSPGAAPGTGGQQSSGASARKSLVLAIQREPNSLEPSLQPQNREWSALGSGFLAYFSREANGPAPYLAEELPTAEKGTWTVLPDGRMETTYRLKKNATWQDGHPITAHDFVFGFMARNDPEMAVHSVNVERRLANATALDDHTLFLEWKEPYLWAGMTHLPDFAPMARHKLERLYQEDRAAFLDGPHWREQFLGSGPFKIASWDPGVELVFSAYDRFVLGRPGVDEIRVKLIGDTTTIVANLLSGNVDAAFSVSIGFPQGQALEQAGWSGKVDYWLGNPRIVEFQGRDWGDTQKSVFDLRVRRAALHAIDRKSIVDGIYNGRAWVAHFWLVPNDPSYGAVDRAVTKYDYDPNRATALLREAGWTRGSDGVARNAAGEALYIPIMNQPTEADALEAAVVVDNWKSVGITSDIHRLSQLEIRDNELRSKFPGMSYNRRNLSHENMVWTERQVSRPETRWSGQNRPGYFNRQLDALWANVLGSTDGRDRERWLIEALRVMQDDAMVTLTHMTPDVMAYNAGIVGPAEQPIENTSRIWNIWEWRWK
jgi:peptide/nickel transport system substrate-binding protein